MNAHTLVTMRTRRLQWRLRPRSVRKSDTRAALSSGYYPFASLSFNVETDVFSALSTGDLNTRLFKEGAAVLKGTDFDMARLGDESPPYHFFRFSFGPLAVESYESDIEILGRPLEGC